MANRLLGNVYIIDSALNNVALPWPSKARIKAVAAWFVSGAGEVRISGADTTNHLIRLVSAQSGLNATYNFHYFGGVDFNEEIKVPVVTNGTAWIYFG